jgi:hypothetical protein
MAKPIPARIADIAELNPSADPELRQNTSQTPRLSRPAGTFADSSANA